MKRRLLSAGFLAAAGVAGPAAAQSPPSGGETSPVLSCFYECKPGPTVRGMATFQEVTTLMVINQGRLRTGSTLVISDANERILAQTVLDLSSEDLDEVNICHTLAFAGIPVPEAGLVELVSGTPTGEPSGVYAWMKNLLGKFFRDNPEPFRGRVTGIAKTACRLAPVPEVTDPGFIVQKAVDQNAPQIPAILVEGTADVSIP